MTLKHLFPALATAAMIFSTDAPAEPYDSTYQRIPAPPTLIENATVLTGTGERLDGASVLLVEGTIEAVGEDEHVEAPG